MGEVELIVGRGLNHSVCDLGDDDRGLLRVIRVYRQKGGLRGQRGGDLDRPPVLLEFLVGGEIARWHHAEIGATTEQREEDHGQHGLLEVTHGSETPFGLSAVSAGFRPRPE